MDTNLKLATNNSENNTDNIRVDKKKKQTKPTFSHQKDYNSVKSDNSQTDIANETVDTEPSFYQKEAISDENKIVMRNNDDILKEASKPDDIHI